MAITFPAFATPLEGASGTTVESNEIVVASGEMIYALVSSAGATPAVPTSVIGDAGVTPENFLTAETLDVSFAGGGRRGTVWRTGGAVPAGTYTVTATWSASQGAPSIQLFTVAGFDNGNPDEVANADTDSGDNPDVTLSTTVPSGVGNKVVTCAFQSAAQTFTPDAGTVVEDEQATANWGFSVFSKDGAASVNSSGSYDANPFGHGGISFSINAPAGPGEPFGDEGYVPTTTDPETAADGEIKHVTDVLDTDYVPTTSDPDTAADGEWKQVSELTSADFVGMVDDPVDPDVGSWLDGDEREVDEGGGGGGGGTWSTITNGNRNFDDVTAAGWGNFAGYGSLSDESDAAAPTSPSGIVRNTAPAGNVGGSSSYDISFDYSGGTTYRSVRVTVTCRLSDPYQGHSSSFNKQGFGYCGEAGGAGLVFWNANGTDNNPLTLNITVQGIQNYGGGTNFPPTLAPGVIVRGEWHVYQFIFKCNTANNADGEIHWWLDGVKLGEVTDVEFLPSSNAILQFVAVSLSPTWGGAGDELEQNQYVEYDHCHVEGSEDF